MFNYHEALIQTIEKYGAERVFRAFDAKQKQLEKQRTPEFKARQKTRKKAQRQEELLVLEKWKNKYEALRKKYETIGTPPPVDDDDEDESQGDSLSAA